MKEVKQIRTCSIWRALEIIGDVPTLLILESYWLGVRRFNGFHEHTGLLKTVISDRLNKLVKADCLRKELYSLKPKRYEYKSTEKFSGLYKTALAMLYWEQKWGDNENKISVELIHKACGKPTQPIPVCNACCLEVDARDVTWEEGPGVGAMPLNYSRRRRSSLSSATPTKLFDMISHIIGDRSATLIIRALFTGINRFKDIQIDSGLATNVLTDRLRELQADAVIYRHENADKPRLGTYKLTEKGRDIYPILLMIMEWGDIWYASPEGPPLLIFHKLCQGELIPEIACSACNSIIKLGDLDFKLDDGSISTPAISAAS